ncbi:MAG: hypothetical protein ACT4QA_19235 [Panacagrimonas sp.]
MAGIVVLGLMLSWNSGLSIDDAFEHDSFEINLSAVRDLLNGTDPSMARLEAYRDRFYGIGFHALSYPLRAVIAPTFERYQGLSHRDALLVGEHVATFLFFVFAGYAVWRILLLAGMTRELATLFTLFFLGNPYLLGHGTFNIKDAPFMCAWILCTWRVLVVCLGLLDGDQPVPRRNFFWLGLATGLLLSIRIAGGMIVIEYLIAIGLTLMAAHRTVIQRWREVLVGLAIVTGTTALLTWLAYPIFWFAPWRIFEAIAFMSHHPWSGCSMTLGQCMPAQDLPWTYIPGWLVVKMSVVGLLGLLVAAALVLRRIRSPDGAGPALVLRLLLASPVVIILLLIAMKAHLYNELRQVLFVVAALYLAAFVALARFPKIAKPLVLGSLAVGAIDHAMAYPYPYVWFNEVARLWPVDRYYETDFWAMASREMTETLLDMGDDLPKGICIFVPFPHQFQPYLPAPDALYLKSDFGMPSDELRPLLLNQIPYAGLHNSVNMDGCNDLLAIERSLFLSSAPMRLSTLHLCE